MSLPPTPLGIAEVKAQLPDISYSTYARRRDIHFKQSSEIQSKSDCEFIRHYMGRKATPLTKKIAESLIGKTIYGFLGQVPWFDNEKRMKLISRLTIVRVAYEGIFIKANGVEYWERDEPFIYYNDYDNEDAFAVIGMSMSPVMVYLKTTS